MSITALELHFEGPNFVLLFRFHLFKENKDTHEALGLIGKMLGIQVIYLKSAFVIFNVIIFINICVWQPRSFGFAGTKDKRSVSTQRVSWMFLQLL